MLIDNLKKKKKKDLGPCSPDVDGKIAKCHLNSFPCDTLKGGAEISASIRSH